MVDPVRFSPAQPVKSRMASRQSTDPVPRHVANAPSKLSHLLTYSTELARQTPPVDHDKIALIHSAIANGSYRIDPEKIAQAMSLHYLGSAR
jgi:flagellar biosynthesis anti-sigma factor FlgM